MSDGLAAVDLPARAFSGVRDDDPRIGEVVPDFVGELVVLLLSQLFPDGCYRLYEVFSQIVGLRTPLLEEA